MKGLAGLGFGSRGLENWSRDLKTPVGEHRLLKEAFRFAQGGVKPRRVKSA